MELELRTSIIKDGLLELTICEDDFRITNRKSILIIIFEIHNRQRMRM